MNIYKVCQPEIKTKAAFSCHIEVKTNKARGKEQESQYRTSLHGWRQGVREVWDNIWLELGDTQPLRILMNTAPMNLNGVLGHLRAIIWLMVNRSNSWLPSQGILKILDKNYKQKINKCFFLMKYGLILPSPSLAKDDHYVLLGQITRWNIMNKDWNFLVILCWICVLGFYLWVSLKWFHICGLKVGW